MTIPRFLLIQTKTTTQKVSKQKHAFVCLINRHYGRNISLLVGTTTFINLHLRKRLKIKRTNKTKHPPKTNKTDRQTSNKLTQTNQKEAQEPGDNVAHCAINPLSKDHSLFKTTTTNKQN